MARRNGKARTRWKATVAALALVIACRPAPAASPGWHALGVERGRATIAVVLASWCEHCHVEVAELAALRARADLQIIGVSFRWHEEYDERGDAAALRAWQAAHAPWLPIVAGDEALWEALGAPPKIPTLYVYDRDGVLRATYDRRERAMPDARELSELLDQL
jgi:hypothetical protein